MTRSQIEKYISTISDDFISWIELDHKDGSHIALSPVHVELIPRGKSTKKNWIVICNSHLHLIYKEEDIQDWEVGDVDYMEDDECVALES